MSKELSEKIEDHEVRLTAQQKQLDSLIETNNSIKNAVQETATALNNQTSVLRDVTLAIQVNSQVAKSASDTIKLVLIVLASIVLSAFVFIAVIFGKVDGDNLINKGYELGQKYQTEDSQLLKQGYDLSKKYTGE